LSIVVTLILQQFEHIAQLILNPFSGTFLE
jgi:hypothetical protein